jgi:hypothetical protein
MKNLQEFLYIVSLRMVVRPLEREGQAMVNTLYEYDIEAANELCGWDKSGSTDMMYTDPFYEDTKIPNLVKALEERWDVKEPS